MKKLFAIAFGLALTTATIAQTPQKKTPNDERKVETGLKNTVVAKKDEKHEAAHNLSQGKVNAALQNRKVVRADRRIIHRKAKHLKKVHGVEHPVLNAQKAAKAEKDEKNGKH